MHMVSCSQNTTACGNVSPAQSVHFTITVTSGSGPETPNFATVKGFKQTRTEGYLQSAIASN